MQAIGGLAPGRTVPGIAVDTGLILGQPLAPVVAGGVEERCDAVQRPIEPSAGRDLLPGRTWGLLWDTQPSTGPGPKAEVQQPPSVGDACAFEVGHDVFGAAPTVDGLGGIADHDQLGVVALAGEDGFQDGVGVLGLVEEEVVGVDDGLGQGPDLQVVVVGEAQGSRVGMLNVGPCLLGVGQDGFGQAAVALGGQAA